MKYTINWNIANNKKLLLSNGKNLLALSREMGISASTITSWRKKMQIYRNIPVFFS